MNVGIVIAMMLFEEQLAKIWHSLVDAALGLCHWWAYAGDGETNSGCRCAGRHVCARSGAVAGPDGCAGDAAEAPAARGFEARVCG